MLGCLGRGRQRKDAVLYLLCCVPSLLSSASLPCVLLRDLFCLGHLKVFATMKFPGLPFLIFSDPFPSEIGFLGGKLVVSNLH